jgi:endonuclease/exonuclease/phosphatase family metal-dependent hydrolase
MRRRAFLKHLGLAASVPCLERIAFAAPDTLETGATSPFKVLSCNIRVALPEDYAKGNGWSTRRDLCIDVIRAQNPDIICLQEVLRVQNEDLERAFPNFGSFGFAGPEMDARMEGYHGIAKNPILYSLDRYEFVSAGGFWLSETPHLPGSLSWDSARARHVNWLRLCDRASGRQFRVLNTHLDHVSQNAREEQIKMILAEAAIYAPEFPQIFAGDFNASARNVVIKLVLDAGWTNAHTAAPGPRDDGPTTHGFLGPKGNPNKPPIDFIMIRGPISALSWKTIRDGRDGRYPSDHYFVSAQLAFTT